MPYFPFLLGMDTSKAIFLGVVSLVFLAVLVFLYKTRIKPDEWREGARRLGLKCRIKEGGIAVSGSLEGIRLNVGPAKAWAAMSLPRGTWIVGNGLAVRFERLLTRRPSIVTGDSAFDSAFYVKCSDADALTSLLTPPVRSALLEGLRLQSAKLLVEETGPAYAFGLLQPNFDRVSAALAKLVAICHALRGAGSKSIAARNRPTIQTREAHELPSNPEPKALSSEVDPELVAVPPEEVRMRLNAEFGPARPHDPSWKLRELELPCWQPRCTPSQEVAGSHFGGRPWLPKGESHPRCHCGEIMPLFLQLELDGLPTKEGRSWGSGLIQLFCCVNREERCLETSQKSSLLRVIGSAGGTPGTTACPGELPCNAIVGWESRMDLPEREEAQEQDVVLSDEEYEAALEMRLHALEGHKLGGWPAWLQGVDYPKCPRCGFTMGELIFQLDSGDEEDLDFSWGEEGNAQITRCREHPDALGFVWTHA